MYGPEDQAIKHYRDLLKEFPDYPDKLTIYQKMLPLAQKTGDKAEVERVQAEIKKLTSAAGTSSQ